MEEGPGLLLQDRERKTMHGQDRLRLELLAQDEIFSFSLAPALPVVVVYKGHGSRPKGRCDFLIPTGPLYSFLTLFSHTNPYGASVPERPVCQVVFWQIHQWH